MSATIQLPPNPPHVPASAVAWAVSALGALGIMDAWGLTADDVAMVLGAAFGLVSAIYAIHARKSDEAAK